MPKREKGNPRLEITRQLNKLGSCDYDDEIRDKLHLDQMKLRKSPKETKEKEAKPLDPAFTYFYTDGSHGSKNRGGWACSVVSVSSVNIDDTSVKWMSFVKKERSHAINPTEMELLAMIHALKTIIKDYPTRKTCLRTDDLVTTGIVEDYMGTYPDGLKRLPPEEQKMHENDRNRLLDNFVRGTGTSDTRLRHQYGELFTLIDVIKSRRIPFVWEHVDGKSDEWAREAHNEAKGIMQAKDRYL